MARTTRSYLDEADQLRARGCNSRQIVAEWRRRYGLNSRVAYRLVHGLTQAETRFSPLTDINATNVGRLGLA